MSFSFPCTLSTDMPGAAQILLGHKHRTWEAHKEAAYSRRAPDSNTEHLSDSLRITQ